MAMSALADHFLFASLAAASRELAGFLPFEMEEEQALIAVSDALPPPHQPGPVAPETIALGEAEAQRLLGDGLDEKRLRELLPFERQIGVAGVIGEGSLRESAVAAGAPGAAMLEVLGALETAIDLDKEVRSGDRFYVRYRQEFSATGTPLDIGKVLWLEVRTAKGAMAIHRFTGRDQVERFWMSNGQAATPPTMRLPLDTVSISSGFGLRADPFDQPTSFVRGAGQPMGGPNRSPSALPPGLPTGGALDMPRNSAALATSPGLSAYGASKSGPGRYAVPVRPTGRGLFMHEGVDLVAPSGTPVYAASDGVVVGAAPNGRYGNWIRISHSERLATVYGHLSGFAPGIKAGTVVSRGDLIGFVGSTGRSTGAHLHFEVVNDGKPVNPITYPELKRSVLRGPDLEKFRKQVAASLADRDREAKVDAFLAAD